MAIRKNYTQLDGIVTDYDVKLSLLYRRNCGRVIDVMFTNRDEYSMFSNMAPRPFNREGNRWKNVESYFQWKKAMTFRDYDTANLIKQSDDGYECRRLGRQVKGFRPEIWNQMKDYVMMNSIRDSFEQNPDMLEKFKDLYGVRFTHVKGGVWSEKFPRILTIVQECLVLGTQKRIEMFDAEMDAIRSAYGVAKRTNEIIGGNYAEEFAGKATWSRALDFSISSWPEFKGLRYIDFEDCTNIHVLKKDGNSVPMESLSLLELRSVTKALQAKLFFIKKTDNKVNKVKM